MDRDLLERHLVQTEAHVALGDLHIAQQQAIVAELSAAGRPTDQAEHLLNEFEELQEQHVWHRNWLIKKLAEITGPDATGSNAGCSERKTPPRGQG